MSLTYGFYNSLNGDRRYTAEQLSRFFNGVINDGVFMSIGDQLRVSASDKMTVIVGSGRAWFDGTWTDNDNNLHVTIPVSELVLNRIDAIVLEVNNNEHVRANSIKVVTGTPATNPSKPVLTNDANVHQHPLAYITVKANATVIKQSDITNAVGTSKCPWVTGILETVDTDELIAQWVAQFDEIYARLEVAIEQTLAAELVDGSVTMKKLASDVVSELNGKSSTFTGPTGAKTFSFTVKGAGSASSNAWRRQLVTVQAWSQGADFANMQMMVDLVNGAPYGNSKCFVMIGRNLPVQSIIYSTNGNDTTYTITFEADAMWALGYVTYKAGLGMSVVNASDMTKGTAMVVDTYVAAPDGYGLGAGGVYPSSLGLTGCAVARGGFYRWDTKTDDAPFANGAMLVVPRNKDSSAFQIACCASGTDRGTIAVRVYSATYSDASVWEYIDPPMETGTEYRTTKRVAGNVIYTKRFSFGTLPKETSRRVRIPGYTNAYSMQNITFIAKSNTADNSMQLAYGADPGFFIEETSANVINVVVNTTGDFSAYNGYVTIEYTK